MIIILHQSSNWICHKLNVCSGHLLYSVDCLNFSLWHVTCVGPCDGLISIQGVLQNVYKQDSEICKTDGPGPHS